jgi:hypothetical protein
MGIPLVILKRHCPSQSFHFRIYGHGILAGRKSDRQALGVDRLMRTLDPG